jgi:hypothetical protein
MSRKTLRFAALALMAAYAWKRRRNTRNWTKRDETLAASFPASDPPPF